MTETYSVPVVFKDGKSVKGSLEAGLSNDWSNLWRVSLSFENRLIVKESSDCFGALTEIRRELEKEDIKLLCYGSCKNVRPSGMSRDMGGGIKAYRYALGKKPEMNDLVNIFATGPDVIPASIREQEDFWQTWVNWLKTLGSN